MSVSELKEILTSRIQKIFEIAVASQAEVLILGAFGCGAFCNPPKVVAEVFAKCVEEYGKYFEVIEFAVYHTDREKANFEAFEQEMKRWK